MAHQLSLTAEQFQTGDDLPLAPKPVENPTEEQTRMLAERSKAFGRKALADSQYADVFDPDDLTWEVSTNAQRTRRAGDARAKTLGGKISDPKITLTWQAFAAWGWGENWKNTITHELAHIIDFYRRGKSGHGLRFEIIASEFDTPKTCPTFVDPEEFRYHLTCPDGCDLYRDKASSVVKNPHARLCQRHKKPLTTEHVHTGRTWETKTGYEETHQAVEQAKGQSW